MQRYFTLPRLASCVLLPAYLAACSSWYVQEVSPQQLVTEEQPEKIRVTLTDGSQLQIEHPRVSGDTLMGYEVRGRRYSGQQVNIPLSDVTDLAIQRTSAGKTTALIFGMVLVVGAAVLVVGNISTAH